MGILRPAVTDRFNPLGQVATQGGFVAAVENTAPCRAALLELGVRPRLASNTAGSGLGPWYLAKAKALSVGLSNAYFKSLGLPSLFEEVSA